MSVNLSPAYRVIVIVAAVGIAFSTLAWSGGSSKPVISAIPGRDTTPAPRQERRQQAIKPRQKAEQGRVARELDLRLDMETPEESMVLELPEVDIEVAMDLQDLQRLNARIEADVLKNGNPWKTLEVLKDMDALEELDRLSIDEEDLQQLKDINIDEDIFIELQDLKERMDGLRQELDGDADRWWNDARVHEEVRKVMEAVRMEIPRVRRAVEKALAGIS